MQPFKVYKDFLLSFSSIDLVFLIPFPSILKPTEFDVSSTTGPQDLRILNSRGISSFPSENPIPIPGIFTHAYPRLK